MVPSIPPPLVVVGGSAGAIGPLRKIIGALPREFPASVCVVIHIPEHARSAMPMVLSDAGALSAVFAEDGAPLAPGKVYVAPPAAHLLVDDGHVRLSHGAAENRARPAIDPLFRTAARAAGPRVVAVLLSGALDDGSAGTAAIRRAGGVTIVQDPAEAVFPDMPRNALATGMVSDVLPAEAIARRLGEVVDTLAATPPAPKTGEVEDTVDRGVEGSMGDLSGTPSPYACPDCGGVLYGRDDNQYLCRVGHRYSPAALASGQLEVVDDALWTALRSLEEAASLAARVRERAAKRGDGSMEQRFERRRADAQARADRIRALLRMPPGEEADEAPDAASWQPG